MGSLNTIKCNCQCSNKTEESSELDCNKNKQKASFNEDLKIDNINMLLESTDIRNSQVLNNK